MTSPNISERIAGLARQVQADPTNIGVLSTGEACAVALLLNRLDLLDDYKHRFMDHLPCAEWQSEGQRFSDILTQIELGDRVGFDTA